MGWRTPESESLLESGEVREGQYTHLSWLELNNLVANTVVRDGLTIDEVKNCSVMVGNGFAGYEQIMLLKPLYKNRASMPWRVTLGVRREQLESELGSDGLTLENWYFRPIAGEKQLGLAELPGDATAIFGDLLLENEVVEASPLALPADGELTLLMKLEPDEAHHALVKVEIPQDQVNQFLTSVYRRRIRGLDIYERRDVLAIRGDLTLAKPTVYYLLLDLSVTRELGWL